MKREVLEAVLTARTEGRAVVVVTHLGSGDKWILGADETTGSNGERFAAEADSAMRRDRSSIVEIDGERYFFHVVNPPLRMYVVGAVHISQPLVPMAELCGFSVTVIDPRRSFASADRFPGVRIDHAWPDEALEAARLDRRSAVVTLTHDPKLDDPALASALGSPAFYIGSLGSRRTHAARLDRLTAAGFTQDDLERIHGPIGLDISAVSPAEIATSIMGQIIETLRRTASR